MDSYNGLNWYDFEARYFDGVRFTTPDPLSEKYYNISPYAYVANNPIKFIDPTGMSLDDYFNEKGQYLGNDNSNTNDIRITEDASWKRNSNGDGSIDPIIGVGISELHSRSRISTDASLAIYQHYNPTKLELKVGEGQYDMQFDVTVSRNKVTGEITEKEKHINVNINLMKKSKLADSKYDIINSFIHEESHYNNYKNKGFMMYSYGTLEYGDFSRVSVTNQMEEYTAIKTQMNHSSWNKVSRKTRNAISKYADRLKILIPGLNIK